MNRKSSGHIKCSMSQSPNLTPFQEVISLTGRVGEEHGVVTVTSRQHTAVRPGGQCAWLPHRLSTLGARDWTPAAQHREKAPWGWAPLTLKSPGAPEKSEGALPSNRDPKTPCESQEGSLLCSGQEAGRGDGLIPISLCAHPVSLSLWVLNPPAESPVSSLELKIPPGRQKSLSNRQRTLQSSPAFFLLVKHPSHCPLCLKRLCG